MAALILVAEISTGAGPLPVETYPKVVEAVAKAGHELNGHGWVNNHVVNDEEVDVESNGHFKKLISFNKIGRNSVVVKAVNAAGKQTIQSETVLVEE